MSTMDKVLILDMLPDVSNEWAMAVLALQGKRASDAESKLPLFFYCGMFRDEAIFTLLKGEIQTLLLQNWWPKQLAATRRVDIAPGSSTLLLEVLLGGSPSRTLL